MFNPTVKDFIKDNEKTTLIGFCWAMQWRFAVAVYGIAFAAIIFFAILEKLFS